jgi:hypothetical protein
MPSRYIGSMFLSAVALSACGNNDVPLSDGGACVGHNCDDTMITDPEGGQIVFEYIYLDADLQAANMLPAGITTVNRVVGFFMNDTNPQVNPLPTPGQCNNLVSTKGWPAYIAPQHTDLDVGTVTITGKNAAGADVTISVDKQPKGTDAFGRGHDTFYQKITPVADSVLKPDSAYSVKFGGAGTIPPTTFDSGLYLASKFDISSPGLDDNGPLKAGTDFTVHWTPTTTPGLPMGDDEAVATWLVMLNGQATHMCPQALSAGQMTIPGSAITEFKQIAQSLGQPTNKAILLRNGVVHQLRRLPNNSTTNKRRIDMITLMCWAQLMDVQ